MPVGLAIERARRWLLLAVGLLLLLVPSLLLRNLSVSRAQTTTTGTQTGTCTIPAGNTTTCSLIVGGAAAVPPPSPAPEPTVAAGGTMTLQLTNPSGAIITSLTGLPTGCAVASGLNSAIVTVACQVASLGIPTGTTVMEVVSFGPGGPTPFVAETVVYNANGPSPAVPTPGTGPVASTGFCDILSLSPPGSSGHCTNTPAAPAGPGGSISFAVTAAGGQNIQIPTSGAPPALGTCPLSTTLPTSVSTGATVTYTCTSSESAPNSTPVEIAVDNAAVAGTPSELTSVVPPSGTPGTSPGACDPLPATLGATGTCTNTNTTPNRALGTASATATVTLSITAAPNQTLAITSAPPVEGTCPLVTTLPTPADATASVSYSCGLAERIPAGTPIAVTVTNGGAGAPSEITTTFPSTSPPPPVSNSGSCSALPVSVGSTAACAGSPVATTVAGDTLAVAVTAAPSQTLSIQTAPPFLGTCPQSTPLPTSISFPGSSVSVAYTCGPAQSVPAGVPIPITVANGNGAPGTPQMTITANAPNPNSPTPIPAPETVSFVFSVTPVTPTPTTIAGTALTVTLLVDGQNNLAPGTGAASQSSLAPGTGLAGLNNLVPGQAIKFLASAMTTNTNATIAGFTFYFSDGSPPINVAPLESDNSPDASGTTLHTFSGPGPYLVWVQAFDSTGASGSTMVNLNIQPTISYAGLYQPLPPAQAAAGTSMSVTLTAVPLIAGPNDTITFSFTAATEVNLGQSYGLTTGQPHTGTGPPSINGTLDFGDGSPVQLVTTTRPIAHQYASPGAYNATLTATDSFGNTGQSTVQVVITMPVPQPAPTSTPAAGQ